MTEETDNTTTQTADPPPPPIDEGFDPARLRTVREMRRSTDDRMVAGVCAGAARYLGVDPVVLRVLIAALSLVGLAGVVLYVAAWILVPEEGADHSIASEHLEGRSEGQLRNTGLLIAGVVALVLVVASGTPWGWDAGFVPWVLFWIVLAYLLLVRPWGRRRAARTPETAEVESVPPKEPKKKRPSHDRGDGTLFTLTVCAALVVAGVVWTLDLADLEVGPATYAAAVLATLGLGLLAGTVVGNARPLVPLGILAALVLLVTSQVPEWSAGQIDRTPTSGVALADRYELGAGEILLDLTEVPLSELAGRTVDIELGAGHTRVEVPDGIDLHVDVDNTIGEVDVLDHVESGYGNDYTYDDDASALDLTLHIDHRVGQVEVVRP